MRLEWVPCNICDSQDYKVYSEVQDWILVRCKGCGLVYLNPRPVQEEIEKIYQREEYFKNRSIENIESDAGINHQIDSYTARVKGIIRESPKMGMLLDVGCAKGFFLACAKRYGWKVTGVDVSEWSTRYAREKLGLDVLAGNLEDVCFKEKFDAITMFHVLEHLSNPSLTLQKAHEILDDDGLLVVGGPNMASWDRVWHGKLWRGWDLPLHLYHFALSSYGRILKKNGFHIKRIERSIWNPFAHFREALLGDGIRADHKGRTINAGGKQVAGNIQETSILKTLVRVHLGKILSGRDLIIYAQKNIKK